MASAKALSIASELRAALARRTTLAVGQVSFDSDKAPLILVGPGGAGTQSMLIKVKEVAPEGTDIVGMAARGYAQHVIQVVQEQAPGNTGAPVLTSANQLDLMGEVLLRGTRVELYMSANGNSVGPEDIVAGNLRKTWEPDLQYRLMNAQ